MRALVLSLLLSLGGLGLAGFSSQVSADELKLGPHQEKRLEQALAGVAQWTECRTARQRVAGLIPSQGTCLGSGPGPQ